AVASLAGEPGLDVVLLHGRGAEVAGGDVDDAVRDAELLDELLLDGEQELVLSARVLGPHEREHLDLVELVDAEHAARVLAGRAGLAAKVRREARVPDVQLVESLV